MCGRPELTVVRTDRFDKSSILSDSLRDEFRFVIETMCDSLNREPPEAVAIENSHQHNGTKSRATKRLALNTVSSVHTLVIFKALKYKGKFAEYKVLKLSVFKRNSTELINLLELNFYSIDRSLMV